MQQIHNELFRFLAGSFNQDWGDEYASANSVVEGFVAENSPEEIDKVRAQLHELLELDLPESEIRSLLFGKYVCSYYYPDEWDSAKDWIRHLLDTLKK